jgi:hypothetical protein
MDSADWEKTAERLRAETPGFVGLTEDEAAALAGRLGATLRLGPVDGVFTMDYRPDRVTALTENGRVVSAQVG